MRLALALVCAPLCLAADPFETDFDQVFNLHRDKVETFESFERLKLEGGIQITRHADGKVSAFDMSDTGPAGCGVPFVIETMALAEICENDALFALKEQVLPLLQNYSAFSSRNNIPSRPLEEVEEGFALMISEKAKAYGEHAALYCLQIDGGNVLTVIEQQLFSDDAIAARTAALAVDRLPVFQPCRR